MKRPVILLCISLLVSCSLNPVADRNLNEIMVQAILSPDFTRQSVLLVEGTNLALIPDKPTGHIDNPVQHARVVVRSATQEVVFHEVSPGLYQDVQASLDVAAGQTYYLEISGAQGRHVTGRTTVPERFHILSPKPDQTVQEGKKVFFAWESSSGAPVYNIGLVLPECARDFFHPTAFTVVGGFPRRGGGNEPQDSVRVWMDSRCGIEMRRQKFKVIAFDTAYSRYNFFTGRPFVDTFKNLDNALGLFASMISDSVTIKVIPPVDLPTRQDASATKNPL